MIIFAKQIWLAVVMSVVGIASVEAAYEETMNPNGLSWNVQTDCGISGKGERGDSDRLQQAIDELAVKGGGTLFFPEGMYLLGRIQLKSNIHLVFDSKAVLKTDLRRRKGKGVGLFSLGHPGERISNVSLRSRGGRARVELAVSRKSVKAGFVTCFGVDNFLIDGFDIYDEQSESACINFGFDSSGATPAMPVNGAVRNLTAYNCEYGYGLIQVGAAKSIYFENLHGVGGCTLRLEVPHGPTDNMEFRGMSDITAMNISCKDGHAAVILGPHFTKNGIVKIYGVRAESCAFAVKVGRGYIDARHEGNKDLKSGTFASGSWVRNIHAVYGENAQLQTKDVAYVPKSRLNLLKPRTEKDGTVGRGPAISAVLKDADYVEIDDVSYSGFGNQIAPVITREDIVTQKPFTLFLGKK